MVQELWKTAKLSYWTFQMCFSCLILDHFRIWGNFPEWRHAIRGSEASTLWARIPNIQILNTFEFQTFQSLVFECFGFRMVGSIAIDIYGYKISSLYAKWPRLAIVQFSNGRDHEPNAINHPKTKHVWYSSPHCTFVTLCIKV